jgi:HSP20 family protein
MAFGYMDPLERLLRLQGALDRPGPDERFGLSTGGAGAFPPVNVFRKGHDFVVMAELPGLARSSLTVEAQKNQVRLAGQRQTASAEGESCHRRERTAGDFDRTITFPTPVDSNATAAAYEDGILTVTLPSAEEARPRAITVK